MDVEYEGSRHVALPCRPILQLVSQSLDSKQNRALRGLTCIVMEPFLLCWQCHNALSSLEGCACSRACLQAAGQPQSQSEHPPPSLPPPFAPPGLLLLNLGMAARSEGVGASLLFDSAALPLSVALRRMGTGQPPGGGGGGSGGGMGQRCWPVSVEQVRMHACA